MPQANESSLLYGPKGTRLLGPKSRLRGWLIPVLCNHGSPASRSTPGYPWALPRCRPTPSAPIELWAL